MKYFRIIITTVVYYSVIFIVADWLYRAIATSYDIVYYVYLIIIFLIATYWITSGIVQIKE